MKTYIQDKNAILNNKRTQHPHIDFTTRLQKGGALLSDMRLMVNAWSDEIEQDDPVAVLARVLPKTTMARVRDTYSRSFKPRFITGNPSQAWRFVRILEDLRADVQILRPIYYWITARAEAPLYGFTVDVVYSRARSADPQLRIDEAVSWLSTENQLSGKQWSPTVTRKMARGILAALRDFGILEGEVRKRVAPVHLPVEACALIAFKLHEMGHSGRDLVQHTDWRLFLLGETGVERLFLECHQHGWFHFESAGGLRRTDFPDKTFEEFASGILS